MKRMLALSVLSLASLALTGCGLFSPITKTSTVTGTALTGFQTNIIVTVNQTGLATDCLAVHALVSAAIQQLIKNDPGAIPVIRDIETVLNGVISGASTTSASQLIGLLGKNTAPATAQQISQLVTQISGYEQKWIQQADSTVVGQITIAFAKAANQALAEVVPLP